MYVDQDGVTLRINMACWLCFLMHLIGSARSIFFIIEIDFIPLWLKWIFLLFCTRSLLTVPPTPSSRPSSSAAAAAANVDADPIDNDAPSSEEETDGRDQQDE